METALRRGGPLAELSIRLPAAPPDTYLRYVAWWEELERFLGADPSLEERAIRAGGPISSQAVRTLSPGHALEVRAQARTAQEEGRPEVSPVIQGDAVLWRIALRHAARRSAWLDELAGQGVPVPRPDPQLQELRRRVFAAIEEGLAASEGGLIRMEPGEAPGSYRLIGEIDMTVAEQVTGVLEADLRSGYPLLLDLSGLTFMDSTGIRLLIQLARSAQSAGVGPVVLVSPRPPIVRVLGLAVPGGIPGVEIRQEGGAGSPGPQGMLFFYL
jgi:anti-anti-sigma factor